MTLQCSLRNRRRKSFRGKISVICLEIKGRWCSTQRKPSISSPENREQWRCNVYSPLIHPHRQNPSIHQSLGSVWITGSSWWHGMYFRVEVVAASLATWIKYQPSSWLQVLITLTDPFGTIASILRSIWSKLSSSSNEHAAFCSSLSSTTSERDIYRNFSCTSMQRLTPSSTTFCGIPLSKHHLAFDSNSGVPLLHFRSYSCLCERHDESDPNRSIWNRLHVHTTRFLVYFYSDFWHDINLDFLILFVARIQITTLDQLNEQHPPKQDDVSCSYEFFNWCVQTWSENSYERWTFPHDLPPTSSTSREETFNVRNCFLSFFAAHFGQEADHPSGHRMKLQYVFLLHLPVWSSMKQRLIISKSLFIVDLSATFNGTKSRIPKLHRILALTISISILYLSSN